MLADPILPRQGEVSPKVTEGSRHATQVIPERPSARATPAPLRERNRRSAQRSAPATSLCSRECSASFAARNSLRSIARSPPRKSVT